MAKYIDADALVEVVKEAEKAGMIDSFSNGFRAQCFDEVLDIIKNAQAIDYLVPVGTGNKVKDEHSFKLFCSRCMHFVDSDDKFCKSCGVKLTEEELI